MKTLKNHNEYYTSIQMKFPVDLEKLLKFLTHLRNIEKLCKTDIRFIWLLDGLKAPSYSTVSNFMNEMLIDISCFWKIQSITYSFQHTEFMLMILRLAKIQSAF